MNDITASYFLPVKVDCVSLEKLRKRQRIVHVLCALCAFGFKKYGKVRKFDRYITQRSIPVWILTFFKLLDRKVSPVLLYGSEI